MNNTTVRTLQAAKDKGEKFTCLTTYDAAFANLLSRCGIELILVGDSLGMVLQGHDSTLPVTLEHMAYHVACVARGTQGPLIIADMPFATYTTPDQAVANASRLMQAGAQMVKLEGGNWLAETVRRLGDNGIPVCAHLGLTPQSVHKLGGYRLQGKETEDAEQIRKDAETLDRAGADLLVLECVPNYLAQQITDAISCPVIGIGAGPDTDGQVLVLHDMLGLTPGKPPRFVKNFMTDAGSPEQAVLDYRQAVKSGRFPAPEHCFT